MIATHFLIITLIVAEGVASIYLIRKMKEEYKKNARIPWPEIIEEAIELLATISIVVSLWNKI